MATNRLPNLKLFSGDELSQSTPRLGHLEPELQAEIQAICSAFGSATGWRLHYAPAELPGTTPSEDNQSKDVSAARWSAPVNAGVGTALGHLRVDRLSTDEREHTAEFSAACILAGGIANLLGRAVNSHVSPVDALDSCVDDLFPRSAGSADLLKLLTSLLRGGAEGLGCDAVAMYLLDEETTRLQLTSQWGLSKSDGVEPERELADALADLEALVGHAVVLDNPSMFSLWNVPTDSYAATVCVPISSPTTILGTLWMFSSSSRDFTTAETGLIEILAGRLAVELERELLITTRRASPPS